MAKDEPSGRPEDSVNDGAEEKNDSPIEQVRLTVSTTDDPTMPVLTFRTWFLGTLSCVALAFVNTFFQYRENPLSVGSVTVMIIGLPIGKLMAKVLPTTVFRVPFTRWTFSLNPGPFNMKEHALITIFASAGASGIYATSIVTAVKAFYKREITFAAALLLSVTTQMLGYGWAGIFRKYLVDSPYMWWPSNLVKVSLFRALHEEEKRPKGGLTRLQFFLIAMTCSFAYYVLPGYLFLALTSLSIACWIWKDSITAQQIGSGRNGLGIGSFALDWNTVVFLGSPLAYPGSAILNIMAGFFLFAYIINPIAYWSNLFEAKKFPLFSKETFDSQGQIYNITGILNEKTFEIDLQAYDNYSKLNLSVFFAFAYGLSFATLAATISHVALFNGKSIWEMWQKTKSAVEVDDVDVHTRLMRKNYKETPQWWFIVILISMMALSIFALEGFGKQLQLPWWGLLLACGIALVFTLPIGSIQATTNKQVGLNVITELIIGYLYPGKPLANVTFKTYGYISMAQALSFLEDFKLGLYMKIPPRSMFWVQVTSTLVAAITCLGTTWWLLTSIKNICDKSNLPKDSPWTCPSDEVFYQASIIWGVVGPARMFTSRGNYGLLNWFFLIGLLAPIPGWILSKKYPEIKWLRLINMPVLIGATAGMPPVRAVNYIMWGAVGVFFNIFIYKRYKGWWARHNYVLSAALDVGVALMGVLIYFTFQTYDNFGPDWWGKDFDQCPLATCPTAPGIQAKGCPIF